MHLLIKLRQWESSCVRFEICCQCYCLKPRSDDSQRVAQPWLNTKLDCIKGKLTCQLTHTSLQLIQFQCLNIAHPSKHIPTQPSMHHRTVNRSKYLLINSPPNGRNINACRNTLLLAYYNYIIQIYNFFFCKTSYYVLLKWYYSIYCEHLLLYMKIYYCSVLYMTILITVKKVLYTSVISHTVAPAWSLFCLNDWL